MMGARKGWAFVDLAPTNPSSWSSPYKHLDKDGREVPAELMKELEKLRAFLIAAALNACKNVGAAYTWGSAASETPPARGPKSL